MEKNNNVFVKYEDLKEPKLTYDEDLKESKLTYVDAQKLAFRKINLINEKIDFLGMFILGHVEPHNECDFDKADSLQTADALIYSAIDNINDRLLNLQTALSCSKMFDNIPTDEELTSKF